jgi:hypothetical protein
MVILGLYIFVIFIALIWVSSDSDSMSAFEFFRKDLHTTAREMGVYREWLVHSLVRFVVLLILVLVNIAVASSVLKENPWDLVQPTRTAVFGVMIGGALALFSLPCIFTRLRFVLYLYWKSAELSALISIIGSASEVRRRLEPAKYDTTDGWTAWHPTRNEWQENKLWAGLTSIKFLYQVL